MQVEYVFELYVHLFLKIIQQYKHFLMIMYINIQQVNHARKNIFIKFPFLFLRDINKLTFSFQYSVVNKVSALTIKRLAI
jgi:hypothetical protein